MRRFLPFAALLGVALVLGCQDVGTGPDGLVPQFNKPFRINKVTCEAEGGFIFDDTTGHCHAGEEPSGGADFDITVTIEGATAVQETVTLPGDGITVELLLDLGFFDGELNCFPAMGIPDGLLSLIKGDAGGPHVHVVFEFTHNGSKHTLATEGVPVPLDDAWDPTTTRVATESPDGNGQWTITAKGKNHQNGCTGEGGGLSFDITIVPVVATT